jgi:DNA-binding HxlR family transcriptional regulator
MPKSPWTGYGRFCPLARALDVIGERWTLVIVQELLKQPRRYNDLLARLPGMSTNVLADRLRTLERAAVVAREPGAVGAGVVYALTDRGRDLDGALRALRRWGVGFLADPTADGSPEQQFDITYVNGIHGLADGQFQLVVDDRPTTLHFTDGRLRQEPGTAPDPELTVRTTSSFLDRWAAGESDWDSGRTAGDVTVQGPHEDLDTDLDKAWPRWLAATGYLLSIDPNSEPEAADA